MACASFSSKQNDYYSVVLSSESSAVLSVNYTFAEEIIKLAVHSWVQIMKFGYSRNSEHKQVLLEVEI